MTFVEWLQSLPIPWLVSNENGAADAEAWGTSADDQVMRLKDAIKAKYPDYAPADALGPIGGDRKLIQGPAYAEDDDDFRIRLKTAWDAWSRAGQPAELLAQLFYGGFSGAIIVTQNGLAYSLSGAPTPGEDPTSLLVITELPELVAAMTPAPPSTSTIPAGTSWWTFDSLTDRCARFAILFPNGAGPFITYGTAEIVDDVGGFIEWNNPTRFVDTNYEVLVGMPDRTAGQTDVVFWEDVSARTTAGTLIQHDPVTWTGTVTAFAWPTGENPFANLSDADLGRLQTLIRRWKPAQAICMNVIVFVAGLVWGWPLTNEWGGAGLVWGGETVEFEAT